MSDFGDVRSALHEGGALPHRWQRERIARGHVRAALGRASPELVFEGRTWDADSLRLVCGRATLYEVRRPDLAQQWAVCGVLEQEVHEFIDEPDPRTLAVIEARKAWALGEIDAEEWAAARYVARAASWVVAFEASWTEAQGRIKVALLAHLLDGELLPWSERVANKIKDD